MKTISFCTALAVAFAGAYAAQAQTQTTSVAATAEVSTVCSVTSTALTFGELQLAGATDGAASVTATCTNGGPYDVGLNNGLNAVAGQRKLVSGANSLNYDLFSDAARTVRWGDAVGVDTVAGVGNGAAQTLAVYGRIAAGQPVNASNGVDYADTVQVTITY